MLRLLLLLLLLLLNANRSRMDDNGHISSNSWAVICRRSTIHIIYIYNGITSWTTTWILRWTCLILLLMMNMFRFFGSFVPDNSAFCGRHTDSEFKSEISEFHKRNHAEHHTATATHRQPSERKQQHAIIQKKRTERKWEKINLINVKCILQGNNISIEFGKPSHESSVFTLVERVDINSKCKYLFVFVVVHSVNCAAMLCFCLASMRHCF